jgi:hypothetical protein
VISSPPRIAALLTCPTHRSSSHTAGSAPSTPRCRPEPNDLRPARTLPHVNAQRAQQLGASITLAADSDEQAFHAAINTALASTTLARSATQIARRLATYNDGERAIEVVEQVVRARAPVRT